MASHSDRVGCCRQQDPHAASPPGGPQRRTLIQLTAAALFAPIARSATLCCDTAEVPPSSVSISGSEITIDLKQAKLLRAKRSAAKLVDASRKLDVLMVHDGRGVYRAFSRICTHGGGPIAYNPGKETIQCTCWGHAEFGFDGSVLAGPAKRPLPVYAARRDGDRLLIQVAGAKP